MSRSRAVWNRSLVLVAALIVVTAPAARAAAAKTVMIHLNGGISLPTGDFGSTDLRDTDGLTVFDARTGFQIGGGVEYMITDAIAVGVDGSFNRNKAGAEGDTLDLGSGDAYERDKDEYTTIQFGVHAKWMFPMEGRPISPYALIGFGAYNTKEELTETYTLIGVTSTSTREYKLGTRFGGKLGVGATYKATEQVGISIEADYNFISQDEAKAGVSSLTYAGVHAGVTFNIMPK